jgi:hypothetical protein
MNDAKIKELKAEIKDLAEKGRACWALIHGSQGYKRNEAWVMKRSIGKGARYLLLQYAYLRDKPYRSLERTGRPEQRIDVGWLAICLGEPVEKVKAWLNEPWFSVRARAAARRMKEVLEKDRSVADIALLSLR